MRTNFLRFGKGHLMSFEFDSSSLADHLRDPADRVQLRKVFF